MNESSFSSKDVESSKATTDTLTIDDIQDLEKGTGKKRTGIQSKKNGESTEEDFESSNLTPLQKAQKRNYESEKKKNDAKAALFVVLGKCAHALAWVVGVFLSAGAIFGAYYISSISEPMGGLKQSVKNLEESNTELKTEVRSLQDKLMETREEYLKESPSDLKKEPN